MDELLDGTVAVIPARGGSKRLPGKNMKMLGGMPLVGWAIRQAEEAGIRDIIVSSDDDSTLEYAEGRGAMAVRPPDEISQGMTPPILTVRHAMKVLREKIPLAHHELVAYLQPTSPFRLAADIVSALRTCARTGADSVVTVRSPREELYHLGHAGRLRLLSQSELGSVFTPNGAVFVITVAHLEAGGDWWDGIMEGRLMPDERGLNIDLHHDFEAAERQMATMQAAGAV